MTVVDRWWRAQSAFVLLCYELAQGNKRHGHLAKADTAHKPSVRHFLAHLHRAAHHMAAASG
jgi:hypothetical protein